MNIIQKRFVDFDKKMSDIISDYYSTMALEVDKRELTYFNDKETLSVKEDELDDTFEKYNNINFFVVDLGKSKKDYLCNEVLYLIEPITIKLNKLVLINPNIFNSFIFKHFFSSTFNGISTFVIYD